jgi:predicted ATPase
MRLQFSIGLSTMIVDGYAAHAAREAYAAAGELAAGFSDVGQIFPVMAGIFGYYVVAGDVAGSARMAARMSEMTAQDVPSPFLLMSRLAEGFVHHSRGDQAAAHETLERAIALYDPAQQPLYLAIYGMDPGINALAQSARTFWLLGQPDRALERAVHTVDLARRLDHRPSLAFAQTLKAIVHQMRGEAADALACADETIALCDEHGILQERAWMLPLRGWALAATGHTDDGIALTRNAVAAYVASGAQHTLPYYYTLLAEELLAAGMLTEATAACDTGLAVSARIGEVAYDAELHRLRGACSTKHTLAAQRDFETAFRIACAQGCRGYESRAAASLALLTDGQAAD